MSDGFPDADPPLPDDMRDWPDDPYQLLGVAHDVRLRDLRRAYTRLIRQYKPEHHPAQFRRIRDAYEVLERLARWRESRAAPDPDDVLAPHGGGGGDPEAGSDTPIARGDPDSGGESANSPLAAEPVAGTPVGGRSEADIDALWQQALREGGEWPPVYRRLVESAGCDLRDEVLFCRLYWLLKLAPELDAQRRPVDWLAVGLSRLAVAPRLMALYSEELSRRPQEALLQRSQTLLAHTRPVAQLAELARRRWAALFRVKRLEAIERDLELLREPFAFHRADWVLLLLSAADVLAWSDREDALVLQGRCAVEIRRATDLELALDRSLERYDHLLALADDWRHCRKVDHPDFPQALVELIPELWLTSAEEARPRLMELFADWVYRPITALDQLDRLAQDSTALTAFCRDAFQSLAPGRDRDQAARRAAERRVQLLAATFDWDAYRANREELLRFYLRTGLDPDELQEILQGLGELDFPVVGVATRSVKEDVPLQCFIAAYRAFWS